MMAEHYPISMQVGQLGQPIKVVTQPPSDDLCLFKNSEYVTDKESCMKYYRMSFHVVFFYYFIK